MSDFDTPQNEIERAIHATPEDASKDPEGEARRATLIALANNNVAVILPPRREDGSPPADAVPLFVSDGPDREQAMLAAFTRRERAEAFRDAVGETDGSCEIQEITGTQLVLGTPEEAGIMINPNQSLLFRISREMSNVMRGEAEASFEHLRARRAPDGGGAK
jgi:hypothetical protein